MRLYPHQKAALEAVKSSIKTDCKAGLIGMPTGTGKTVIFCTLGHDLDWPTLILVHRDELVRQTATVRVRAEGEEAEATVQPLGSSAGVAGSSP